MNNHPHFLGSASELPRRAKLELNQNSTLRVIHSGKRNIFGGYVARWLFVLLLLVALVLGICIGVAIGTTYSEIPRNLRSGDSSGIAGLPVLLAGSLGESSPEYLRHRGRTWN